MANDEILNSKELRLRVTEMEYDVDHDASKNKHKINEVKHQIKKEIKKIYKDETGKELKADITVTLSEEKGIGAKSGYGGTAIRFKNKEKGINQVYFISQGTQDEKDWVYDLRIPTANSGARQYKDARKFYNEVISKNKKEKTIALAHSLGYNTNADLRLVDGYFNKVYGVNGAQPNVYQLYQIDQKFRDTVNKKFNIHRNDTQSINNISPHKLEAFAKDYYNNKKINGKSVTKDIHQIKSEDDPLNNLTKHVRGFFYVGDVETIDTDEDHKGIGHFAQLSDQDAKEIQEFLTDYGDLFDEKGLKRGITAAIGLDSDKSLKENIQNARKNLPMFAEKIRKLINNSDKVFDAFIKAGYMDESDKKEIIKDLKDTEKDLTDTLMSISSLSPASIFKVQSTYEKIQKRLGHFQQIFGKIGNIFQRNHSIDAVLDALALQKVRAKDFHLPWTNADGQTIQINLSSAARIYKKGMETVKEEKAALDRYKKVFTNEITNDYEDHKQRIIRVIADMEANPSSYKHDLLKHTYAPTTGVTMKKVQVHESFKPLLCTSVDSIPLVIEQQIKAHEEFLEEVKTSFEKMFKEDKRVAKLFDLS